MKARIRPSNAPAGSRRSAGLAGLLGVLACSWQLACSSHNAPGAALARSTATSNAAAKSSAPGAASAEPRFFVTARAVTRPESEIVTRAREGGPRRSIVRGFRLVEHADGRFNVAQDVLPGVGENWAPLPTRLGGGFVFWTVLGTETALYSAPEFTAPLRPLARVDFNLERLATGFDRLYLFAADTGEVLALDPTTGKVRDLGALPDAPGFAALEFVDDWFAVALPAFQGPLATFDAGSSWHPVPVEETQTLQPVIRAGRPTAVALVGAGGRTLLDAGGRLTEEPPSGEPSGRPHSRGIEAARPRYGRGLERVEAAILHGYAETPSTALLLADGDLVRVQLQSGEVLARTEKVSSERTTCSAIRLGAGAGFICAEPTGPSSVYQLVAPLGLERVLHFTSPRKFTPSESGALVIEGPCAERATAAPNTLERCVRLQDGRTRSLTLGAESQIAVLPEQIVAEVVPPRTSRAGQLRLHGPKGVSAKPLRTRDLTPKVRKALESGLWLEGLEAEAGGVAGWIASGQRLVGVRVARDGSVRAGIMEDDLARTLVSGRFALSIRPGGAGRETTNFGFDWRSFSLPARLDTGARAERSGGRGCSALGCVHGEWMRLGWGRVSTPLREPPTPEGAVFTSTGGGWWLLRCALTGRTLDVPRRDPRLMLRQVPRVAGWRGAAPTGLSAAVIESTPWTPFVGAAPPTRCRGRHAAARARRARVAPRRLRRGPPRRSLVEPRQVGRANCGSVCAGVPRLVHRGVSNAVDGPGAGGAGLRSQHLRTAEPHTLRGD
jgi:hypothetical protein